jgi:hypothetical protein
VEEKERVSPPSNPNHHWNTTATAYRRKHQWTSTSHRVATAAAPPESTPAGGCEIRSWEKRKRRMRVLQNLNAPGSVCFFLSFFIFH